VRLEDLDVFSRIVALASLTAAARELGIPKSNVARRLSRLEDELNCQLFRRTTRSIALTDDGLAFLPYARRLLDDSLEARAVLQKSGRSESGLVTISASLAFGKNFLAPHLPAFRRKFPLVRVEMRLTSERTRFSADGVDLAVRIGPLIETGLSKRPLGHIAFGLYATAGYINHAPPLRAPEDLAKHELIELRPPVGNGRIELVRDKKTRSVNCVTSIIVNDPETALVLAMAGGGIAPLPVFLVADALRRRRLQPVLPTWCPPPAPVHLLFPDYSSLRPRVRAYADFVFETIGPEARASDVF
jgi:DNA-binding transcriptional LysR family regulator